MPKRVVDGEGVWRSTKLALLSPRTKPEYANLLPLATANGTFECDPERVWSVVYSFNRREISVEDVSGFLDDLGSWGMLFRWTLEGKIWGYFTGIEKSGRLPGPSRRNTHEPCGPEPPQEELEAYIKQSQLIVMDARRSKNGIQRPPIQESSREGDVSTSFPGLGIGLGIGLGNGNGKDAVVSFEELDLEMPIIRWMESIFRKHGHKKFDPGRYPNMFENQERKMGPIPYRRLWAVEVKTKASPSAIVFSQMISKGNLREPEEERSKRETEALLKALPGAAGGAS